MNRTNALPSFEERTHIYLIKTCAYNNRFALKCAFGESYNELYPGTIYSPPSYDAHFPSAIMSS